MAKSKKSKPWLSPNPRMNWPSAWINSDIFIDYFERLKTIAISTFEWVNLPAEIDPRFIELSLFEQGMAVFYFDEMAQLYVCLTCQIGGELNIYRIPKRRRAYATNGYNYTLSDKDSILIFNNFNHTSDYNTISLYAQKLYEIESTISVNAKTQKFPFIILSTETQRLVMENLFMKYDGNIPFIFGNKGLDLSQIQTLNLEAPFNIDKLQFVKHLIWNEALNYLGIETSQDFKMERLVQAEIESSMGGVLAQRYSRLNARKMACEQINRMFGLNIDVRMRQDFQPGYTGDTSGVVSAEEIIKDDAT